VTRVLAGRARVQPEPPECYESPARRRYQGWSVRQRLRRLRPPRRRQQPAEQRWSGSALQGRGRSRTRWRPRNRPPAAASGGVRQPCGCRHLSARVAPRRAPADARTRPARGRKPTARVRSGRARQWRRPRQAAGVRRRRSRHRPHSATAGAGLGPPCRLQAVLAVQRLPAASAETLSAAVPAAQPSQAHLCPPRRRCHAGVPTLPSEPAEPRVPRPQPAQVVAAPAVSLRATEVPHREPVSRPRPRPPPLQQPQARSWRALLLLLQWERRAPPRCWRQSAGRAGHAPCAGRRRRHAAPGQTRVRRGCSACRALGGAAPRCCGRSGPARCLVPAAQGRAREGRLPASARPIPAAPAAAAT